MIKVVIVDDHDVVRFGIRRLLEDVDGLEVTGECCNGEQAVEIAKSQSVDVFLMDIQMPGLGGVEATKIISELNVEAKIIVISGMNDDPLAISMLKSGASGYLSKGASVAEMVKAIHEVINKGTYISPEIAQKIAISSLNETTNVNPFDLISEREMQIAMMIFQCKKVAEIADKLCLSPKTVNSYRYRMFDKLDVDGDVELTLLAAKHKIIDVQNLA
ncbi:MAG: response regulator [Saccharospirillaceae bacterium]|nr:response regulator [Pseudomonadales bacterium]NRB79011.1 response regulator [Saccharospirillaceae bacterium]